MMYRKISIPVSIGEVIDKITILEIKIERFSDDAKRANATRELQELVGSFNALELSDCEELMALRSSLKNINQSLWDIESAIRSCETMCDFRERFIELARKVYQTNDIRSDIKMKINRLTQSDLVEEKQY